MKKYMAFILLFSILFAACKAGADEKIIRDDNDLVEIKKVNMTNMKEKFNYLIKKLEINKKYYFKDQKNFLEYVIIGTWYNPPRAVYLFKNTKQFIMATEDEKITGKWRFSSDGLELDSNGKIINAKISYFALYKDKEEDNYYFDISFTAGSDIFLSIDTSLVKLWEKNPPIK